MEEILPKGGYLLFSGPYIYPKHLDPIDNLFRPESNDLIKYFNALDIVEESILKDYTYFYYLSRNWRLFIGTFIRILSPFYKFNKWRTIVIPKLRYLNRNYEVTCVLLRKNDWNSYSGNHIYTAGINNNIISNSWTTSNRQRDLILICYFLKEYFCFEVNSTILFTLLPEALTFTYKITVTKGSIVFRSVG